MAPLVLAVAATAFVSFVPSSHASTTPVHAERAPTAPTSEKLEAEVDALVARFLKRPGAAGLSVAIAKGDELVLAKGYGLADAEFDAPADADTCFRIGSVTKQFTATLVMKFVEEKKLGLDDDLSKHCPEFPLQGKKVTIRQLLNHTSGIPSYTDIGEAWEKVWPLELSHAELLALVKDKPFDFEPGTSWAYNNTGYYLLGMVLEKLSGATYDELVRKELAKPLGLERTRRDSNVDLIKNRAQGYGVESTPMGPRLVNDQVYGTNQPGAAGMLLSTAKELVTWQRALTSGRVVSKESFAQMTTPTVLPDGKNTDYGFGLMIGDFEGHRRISHGGGIFGFNSILAWYPDDALHVAVISNGEALRSEDVEAELVWIALGLPRPTPKDLAIPADKLSKLAGVYTIGLLNMQADVTAEGGKLFLKARAPGQEKFRLLYQGESEFRAEFDPKVKVLFSSDGASFRLFQGGGQFEAKRDA
ncbi:MAG: beta-lactamase family protein [Planctomycetes bacterium]|nr:beta-lactamase family protein [Planctomycetota bacterium]